MQGFWSRLFASYIVSLLALYLAIALVAISGVWRNDFFHVTDNLCTALVICLPNAFFGASHFRRTAIAVFFGGLAAITLVMIGVIYRHYFDELRLFWPVWVSYVVVISASWVAYPPCAALMAKSIKGESEMKGGW